MTTLKLIYLVCRKNISECEFGQEYINIDHIILPFFFGVMNS